MDTCNNASMLIERDRLNAQIAALQAELDRLKLQLKARDILLMKIGIDPAKIQVDDNG